MRFGYWMPVFGGWLRNVEDEGMPVAWPYLRDLAVDSERHGFDLSLVAELNLNDIKGHRAPAADAWTLGAGAGRGDPAAGADARGPAELPRALADRQGAVHAGPDRARPDQPQRGLLLVGRRGQRSTACRSTCTTRATSAPRNG